MAHISDRWHRKDRTRTDRYGKGLRWQVEWVDETGAKRKRSFEHKVLAEDFLTEIRHEQKRGIYRGPTSKITVSEVYEQWMATHPQAPANTLHAERMAFRLFAKPLGARTVDSLRRRDIQDVVNSLMLDYAPNTIRNAAAKLGTALRWGVREDLYSRNPYEGIRLPREPQSQIQPMTVEDLHAAAALMPGEPFRTLVFFCAATGLRISEARAVTWDRISGRTLRVDRQLDARGVVFTALKTPASRRKLTLGAETLEMLEALRGENGEGENRAIFHLGGRMLTQNQTMYRWRAVKDALGFTGWHQLRHFHATHLIHAGFSPVAVAHRLGHKDANMTLSVYAHLWPTDDGAMADWSDSALTLHMPSDRPPLRAVAG